MLDNQAFLPSLTSGARPVGEVQMFTSIKTLTSVGNAIRVVDVVLHYLTGNLSGRIGLLLLDFPNWMLLRLRWQLRLVLRCHDVLQLQLLRLLLLIW